MQWAVVAAAYLHGGHDQLRREGLGLALEQQRVPALSEKHLQGLRFGGLAEVEERLVEARGYGTTATTEAEWAGGVYSIGEMYSIS